VQHLYSIIKHDGSPYGWLLYLRVMELEKLSVEEASWGSAWQCGLDQMERMTVNEPWYVRRMHYRRKLWWMNEREQWKKQKRKEMG